MIKIRKPVTTLVMMLCFVNIYSQTSLKFCTWVQPHGECVFNNTKFISSPDSSTGKVFMEVYNAGLPIGVTSVIFKIFSLDKNGTEKYDTLVQQNIQANWDYAWMPHNFKSPGKYTIRVYSEADKMICTNKFEMIRF